MITISRIAAHHIEAVAGIHLRAFPRSALSRLGVGAVRRYYEFHLYAPDRHFIGAFDCNVLRGYAVGGRCRGTLSGFLRRHKYYLAVRLLCRPGVLLSPEGRRALNSAFKIVTRIPGGSVPPSEPSGLRKMFGVLAVAVDPAYHGKGFGRKLMAELYRLAVATGHTVMDLTVHPDNANAVGFYLGSGWIKSPRPLNWEGHMELELIDGAHRLN